MIPRTVGVEEEFLLVDPVGGQPRAIAFSVLAADSKNSGGEVAAELQLQQVETGTKPCRTLSELDEQVRLARHQAAEAARSIGVEIAAVGTSPLPARVAPTPSPRYRRMIERFGMTAEEQLTCGCHVHVAIGSEDEGVAVLDRIQRWLAPFLALSANSPFWHGNDSRYASYRSQVWSRWPSAGPTEPFGTPRAYHDTVRAMTDSGTVLDSGMVYFDARLSQQYPTIEIRIADVCLDAGDTVLLAALVRALVETAAREWTEGCRVQPMRSEMLRLAAWRAGRSGLEAELVHPETMRPAPAKTVAARLLAHVREVLEDNNEYPEVSQRLEALLRRGNGAQQQRATYHKTGRLADVVAASVQLTQAS